MREIYADCAATTPVYAQAINEVNRIMSQVWGNPSSDHPMGEKAKAELERARQSVAQSIDCKTNELYFTLGGSESNTWGITKGVYANPTRKKIVVSKIEHPSVLNTCKYLSLQGFSVEYIPASHDGKVLLSDIEKSVDENTALLVLMHANNETGMIQDIKEAAALAHARGALVFCDCVQSVGHIPVSFSQIGADMISFSGHKFGAPKGIGGLVVSEKVKIEPLVFGGGQEKGMRGGTENLPYACAMARALKLSLAEDRQALKNKRDALIDGLLAIDGATLNGTKENRLDSIVSVCFSGIIGQSAVMLLAQRGIYASSASACSSSSQEPSHVLLAMGYSEDLALSSVRFSISPEITYDDIDYIIEKTSETVSLLRDNI